MKSRYSIIMVTCASRKEAASIADSLLDKRLIACASIVGRIESRYRWKGALARSAETVVLLKSTAVNFRKIQAEVRRLHSYEVPEIIALPIEAGSREYLRWIACSVKF